MNRMVEMERKVTKFGNSLGITMTDALKQIGLDQGDTVLIDINQSTGEIIIKSQQRYRFLMELVKILWILWQMLLINTIRPYMVSKTDDSNPFFIRPRRHSH